ncbi:MAG TPA: NRDE family protein [Burkholderiales bacterium]|nr:NRDE family protein [Burkholderiales bacterium]
MRPDLPLVVAANRDEFHARPATRCAWWKDRPEILAGRDLEAGGTWMGVSRSRRFAAVTNYRGAREARASESRGALVTGALLGSAPADFIAGVERRAAEYSGFNLLVADDTSLWWLSNRGGAARSLSPGIYGLGNTLLDADEVSDAKGAFADVVAATPAIEVLVGVLARWRIVNALYGTRCTTVLLKGERSLRYAERSYSDDGTEQETLEYGF